MDNPMDSSKIKTAIVVKKKPWADEKKNSHMAGLEPATFRLTAERANRLRHTCSSPAFAKNTFFIAVALTRTL